MAPSALWFGPPERPLFARLYQPAGATARGAVVLCPPFGIESSRASRAYRELGAQLASEGFAVLHIDYDGTGDSAGAEDDPGRVDAWKASIAAAVDLLRAGGARHVSLVGMRLGATLAASASPDCNPDALVLWDPCDNVRSYLREQAVLRLVYEAAEDRAATSGDGSRTRDEVPGEVEALGVVYGPDTVRAMSELTFAAIPDALAGCVLALLRPERAPKQSVLDRLAELRAQFVDAFEQERLVSESYGELFVPQGTIDVIVRWLLQRAAPEMAPFKVPAPRIASVRGTKGQALTEGIMHLGPHRLFAVLTRSTEQRPEVTVVLLSAGESDHTGPGRLWVDLARSWASEGLAVLRVDMSGIGDSPPRPGQPVDVIYSREALEDVADIVGGVSPGAPSAVVLMGLCSGAYHALRTGADLGVGGVLAINPVFSERLRDIPGLGEAPGPPGPARTVKLAAGQGRAFAHRKLISANKRLVRVTARLLSKVGKDSASVPGARHLARPLGEMWWWCVNRVYPGPRPAQVLERLAERGVYTFVICGQEETTRIRRGEEGRLRRLEKSQFFHMELVAGMDHSLFTRVARGRALPLLTENVISHYGKPTDHRDQSPATFATTRSSP